MTEVILTDFQIVRPAFEKTYAETVSWLAKAHTEAEATNRQSKSFDREAFHSQIQKTLKRVGCGPNHIAKRGVELSDFLHTNWESMRLFRLDQIPAGNGMEIRTRIFEEFADQALERFYPGDSQPPGNLIHVTCTGYVAPSPVQKLVGRRGWHHMTGVTHAYHMGCYASLPAVRMAAGYLASEVPGNACIRLVDIVHTELCTLHLNPSLHTLEQLVVQSLFADGYVKYSAVEVETGKKTTLLKGLAVMALAEEIIPDSLHAMEWVTADFGMHMTLSREVPSFIQNHIKNFLKRLCSSAGFAFDQIGSEALYAVHPGGPKIIDQVAETLHLEEHQIAVSRGVLSDYGNMSSATLPHVWERMLKDDSIGRGKLIISLAFGPGLTMYGALFRKT